MEKKKGAPWLTIFIVLWMIGIFAMIAAMCGMCIGVGAVVIHKLNGVDIIEIESRSRNVLERVDRGTAMVESLIGKYNATIVAENALPSTNVSLGENMARLGRGAVEISSIIHQALMFNATKKVTRLIHVVGELGEQKEAGVFAITMRRLGDYLVARIKDGGVDDFFAIAKNITLDVVAKIKEDETQANIHLAQIAANDIMLDGAPTRVAKNVDTIIARAAEKNIVDEFSRAIDTVAETRGTVAELVGDATSLWEVVGEVEMRRRSRASTQKIATKERSFPLQ